MKIDDAQKRFGELRSRVEDSLEQMEEALPLAQHFQEAHQGFLAWANKMETELRAVEHTLPESEETVEVSRERLLPPQTVYHPTGGGGHAAHQSERMKTNSSVCGVCVCACEHVRVLHGIFGMLYILSRSLCREQECDGIWTVMLVFEGFNITLVNVLSVYFMGISLHHLI